MKRVLLVGLCVALPGCVTATEMIRDMAAADFECPAEKVRVGGTDAATRRTAEACGKTGVYKWNGETWVLAQEGTAAPK